MINKTTTDLSTLLVRVAAIVCGLAVVLGAFGAHALDGVIGDWYEAETATRKLESWETGIRYQMFHGLACLALAGLCGRLPGGVSMRTGLVRVTLACFVFGVAVFSGGLYAWVLTDIKGFVMAVPLGGLGFIFGWFCLFAATFASKDSQHQEAQSN